MKQYQMKYSQQGDSEDAERGSVNNNQEQPENKVNKKGRPKKTTNQNEEEHASIFTKNDEGFHANILKYAALDNELLKKSHGFWSFSTYLKQNKLKDQHYRSLPKNIENQLNGFSFDEEDKNNLKKFFKNCLSCAAEPIMNEILKLMIDILKRYSPKMDQNQIFQKIKQEYKNFSALNISFCDAKVIKHFKLKQEEKEKYLEIFEKAYLKRLINILISVKIRQPTKYYDDIYQEGKDADKSLNQSSKNRPRPKKLKKTESNFDEEEETEVPKKKKIKK